MLRSFPLAASSGFRVLVLVGCAEKAANQGAPAGTTTTAKSDAAAVAPSRYGEAKTPEAISAMMKSTAQPKPESLAHAGASAAPTPGIPVPGVPAPNPAPADEGQGPGKGGDKFAYTEENPFLNVKDSPLSTFSIDVDTPSYSNTLAYRLQHHFLL